LECLEQLQVDLERIKVLFIVVTVVLALFVASPALQRLMALPATEQFTELWLVDSGHKTGNFPYNITRNQTYDIYLGVSNHLGSCAYYSVQVKFSNSTQPLADSFNRTSSSLPPLYSFNAFVADNERWELPISFSFDYSYDKNLSMVNYNQLVFNGVPLSLKGYATSWDYQRSDYYGKISFELWIYNNTLGDFQYHERFVDLKLNMTI
jgi:hypothetical protein